MAFDSNNSADLLKLKTEVNTDPISMGYDPAGPTVPLLKLLNEPASNVGGETIAETLTTGILLDVMVISDFDSNQVTDGERRFIESFLGRDFSTDIDQWKTKIQSAFKSNSSTSQAIDSLVRPRSRAEVLFEDGTLISRTDWFAARDS